MSKRADVLCVEKGLFLSREQAKRAINEGIVFCNNQRITKPSLKLEDSDELVIVGEKLKYVSRGGLKLEKAIQYFNLDLKNCIMMDIGSSTGGFTDCALQNGAKMVYAIDVGTDQLVESLRNDSRVVVYEQTNFRHVTLDMFEKGLPNFASIDVSFISLKHIFKPLSQILKKDCYFVALIKPQFEAGKNEVNKKGIITDRLTHKKVILNVMEYAHNEGMCMKGLTYSPVSSDIGNIEFLGLFKNANEQDAFINIQNIVDEAHLHFKG